MANQETSNEGPTRPTDDELERSAAASHDEFMAEQEAAADAAATNGAAVATQEAPPRHIRRFPRKAFDEVVVDKEVRVEIEAAPATPFGFQHRVNPMGRTRDKVAIVGFTDHRVQALELGDDFEIWGLNELYQYMPINRFHRWFEIHHPKDLTVDEAGKKHLRDMAAFDIPVYMHEHYKDIPPSMPFPRTELERLLGSEYFTSSPAWMLGMAIAFGFRTIHVYGIDMAQETEYAEQRPCCEYWLGRAHAMGIDVYLPPTSDLLSAVGQYAFGEAGDKFRVKLDERLKWLHEKDNALLNGIRGLEAEFNQKMQKLQNERNQMVGAIQDCNFWRRSWAVSGSAKGGSPVPDRTQDPRTGITAGGAPSN